MYFPQIDMFSGKMILVKKRNFMGQWYDVFPGSPNALTGWAVVATK
jgi:hypothetical protein